MRRIERHDFPFDMEIGTVRFRYVLRAVDKSHCLGVRVADVIRDAWRGARRGLEHTHLDRAPGR